MKFKRIFSLLAVAGMLTVGFSACGDDDPEPGTGNEGGDPSVGPGEVDPSVNKPLSSTDAGNYLDETAVEVANLFKPEDQKEVVDVFNNYAEKYAEYEFDEDDFNFEVGGKSMLTVMAKSMVKGMSGDVASLSRAANAFVTNYNMSFDMIKGIYTPDSRTETWRRDPNSSDVIFRFGSTEVKVQVSGGNWDLNFVTEDWDYDYNYETNNYEEIVYEDHYNVTVPKNIVVTVTESGKELVHSTIESNLDRNGKNFRIKTNMRAANLTLDAVIEGNNSRVTESQSFLVSGTRVVASTATVNGSNMCDEEYLSELFEDDIEDSQARIDNTFRDGSAMINIADRVQVKATMTKIGTLMVAGDYDGESSWNSHAESDAAKFASALANNVKAQMYFGNTDAVQANIEWQKYFDEYYAGYGEWMVEPVIVFVDDNSRFTFEEYFGEARFADAINKFSSLFDVYASLWK